ncbi:ATP-binding protein [Sneathiella chinensis]|nr:ATP-binding protein [Sneathiella chinensis]
MARLTPILIILAFTGLSIACWSYLENGYRQQAQSRMEAEAGSVGTLIKLDLESGIPALKRMVSRWETNGGLKEREFIRDAENYVRDIPGLQAIEWADPDFVIRWVAPLQGNEAAVGLNVKFEKRRREALENARLSEFPTLSQPINLVQGGKGIISYLPVYTQSGFDGMIIAVYRTDKWLSNLLEKHWEGAGRLGISVHMNDTTIYEDPLYAAAKPDEGPHTRTTEVYGQTFSISVVPSSGLATGPYPYLSYQVAGALFLVGLLIAFAAYRMYPLKRQNLELRRENTLLLRQSRENYRAENMARTANEAKTKFLTGMSHEIRTPLNSVLGILQLVEKENLPADVAQKLASARKSGFYLLNLINQVLEFTKIENKTVEQLDEDFTVSNLVRDVHATFSAQAKRKGINFDYRFIGPEDERLHGDYNHIQQILFNLVSNAVKFTEMGTVSILARIHQIAEDRYRLLFEIVDTGPGIPETDLEAIFEDFCKSDAGINDGGGSGLGLSISEELARMLGGTITVESTVGTGSVFKFSVEVRTASERQHVDTESPVANNPIPPKSILVAEDNNTNQMIIREMLKMDGHSVVVVNDGMAAVEKIQENPAGYDLVFMDIQMPVMDGVEATKAIRSIVPAASDLPILALTANVYPSQIDQYAAAGMQDTLTKPIVQNELRAVLNTYLGASTKKRQDADTGTEGQLGDVIDLSVLGNLLDMMNNRAGRALIHSIRRNLQKDAARLRSEDLPTSEIVMISHDIAGLAANTGMKRLAAHAKNVEIEIEETQTPQALVAPLILELELALFELSKALPSLFTDEGEQKTG